MKNATEAKVNAMAAEWSAYHSAMARAYEMQAAAYEAKMTALSLMPAVLRSSPYEILMSIEAREMWDDNCIRASPTSFTDLVTRMNATMYAEMVATARRW